MSLAAPGLAGEVFFPYKEVLSHKNVGVLTKV